MKNTKYYIISLMILLILLAQTTYSDSVSPPALKWGYGTLFLWLIYTVAVTSLTVIKSSSDKPLEQVETRKKSIWKKLFVVVLIIWVSFFLWILHISLFSYILGDYPIYLLIFAIIGVACGKAATSIFKDKTSSFKQIESLTIFLVILIITSQLLILSYGLKSNGHGGGLPDGWSKLRPISASIAYKASDDTFEATFHNTVGTSVRLISITVNESLTPAPNDCTILKVNNVTWTEGEKGVSVKAGDGFEVMVTCASNSAKEEGDPFDMLIKIEYTAVMGGINTEHIETGHIRGPAEA